MTNVIYRCIKKRRIYALLCAICCMFLSKNSFAYGGEVVRFHENSGNMIALTFDDGPHGSYTNQILNVLSEYGINATFFVIGENCERHPEIVERIKQEGHEIGNHTFYHNRPWTLSCEVLTDELSRTASAVYNACGEMPSVFRPPEGVANGTVVSAAAKMNYNVILWTVDTRDWDRKTTADDVYNNILQNVRSGSIILCHDGVSRPDSVTIEAISKVIPELLARGYKFVTVSELINQ